MHTEHAIASCGGPNFHRRRKGVDASGSKRRFHALAPRRGLGVMNDVNLAQDKKFQFNIK
jgi:hypothetical protein